jgi:hypothetical protein
MDSVVVAAILAPLWFERGKPASLRPSYIGLAVVTTTTELAYWLEPDMYLS